jgi:hypothetical protein
MDGNFPTPHQIAPQCSGCDQFTRSEMVAVFCNVPEVAVTVTVAMVGG